MESLHPETNIKFLYPFNVKTNFGIYNFNVPEHEPIFKTVHWVINIDVSGSMMDSCKDGQTKINQIKHALKNMIKYFLELKTEQNINQYITLIAFDNQIKLVSYNEEINEAYVKKFNKTLIKQFEPTGMTDIGIALDAASNIINGNKITQQTDDIPETPCKTIHIFLTDGEITKGEIEPDKLKSKITTDDNISNVFIGFGKDHSGKLLEDLADTKNGEYYFIESLEKAGMVYGEVIYNSLYEAFCNLTLTIENGKFYNYKTNTWVETLEVGNIPYGAKKTWHIKTDNEFSKVKIIVGYESILQKGVECHLSNINTEYPEKDTINKKVEKYKWRQETQELIAETKKYIQLQSQNAYRQYYWIDSQLEVEEEQPQEEQPQEEQPQQNLITKLDNFMLRLKSYIEKNNLQEDTFMKNLTDDIYVSIHSITSDKGYLYLSARQCSQGSQRAYNMTDYEELINPNCNMNSGLSSYTQSYETSSSSVTTYSTGKTSGLMRTINTQ